MSKAAHFRSLLHNQEGVILVGGAHDAISARLIERAGYDAIWTSGFGISTAYLGMVDAGLLTLTEHAQIARNIATVVSLPVLSDCDNGYGNAINVMRSVTEFEAAGVAGICLEDNAFPKRNSFYSGVQRDLVAVEEHAGKIRAAKRAQQDRDFVVVARCEALIAGLGLEEAIRRADAYADAGADALLMHSKSPTLDELRAFTSRWRRLPLVSVPTTYDDTTVTDLAACGLRVIIFANQALRAGVAAASRALEAMIAEGRPAAARPFMVPMDAIHQLVGIESLRADERTYLPPQKEPVGAVILAAGFEEALMPLVQNRPKALLAVRGKTILELQIKALNSHGVRDISVVRGYAKESFTFPNLRYFDNDRFLETGEIVSLFAAEEALQGRTVLLYGDILFDEAILGKALAASAHIVLVVDRAWGHEQRVGGGLPPPDLVVTETLPTRGHRFVPREGLHRVLRIGRQIPPEVANGEFIGLVVLSPKGTEALRDLYRELAAGGGGGPFHEAPSLARASVPDLLQEAIDRGSEVAAVEIYKGWAEVDTLHDYRRVAEGAPQA